MTLSMQAAAAAPTDALRVGRKGVILALGALALIVAWTWTRIGHWGVAQDAANQLYVAWLMSRGAVIYRDVFEINWPGNFLLHQVLLATFGDGDRTWWWLNAALVATIAAMVATLVRPAGAVPAALGVVLVAAAHVCAGPLNLVQRDQIVGASVLLAALAARRGGAGVVLAGAVVGFAATVKPFAFAFLPAVPLIAAHDRGPRAVALAAAGTGLGAALALAAVFGRLWLVGGLEEFVAIQLRFVLPFYGGADERFGANFLVRGLISYTALAPLLPVAAIGLIARPPPQVPSMRMIAGAIVAYGAVHLLVQGKAFAYHSLPLIYGLIVAAGIGAGWAMRRTAGAWILTMGLAFVTSIASHLMALQTQRAYRSEVTQAIIDDLAPRLRPGDLAQPLDTVSGAINALRVLRVPPPTRHIYDFVFFLGPPGDPFVTALRREFVAGLAAWPPRAIVITSEQWPSMTRGYERWSEWPEFVALLERNYALTVERALDSDWGYRIYLRRE